MFDLGFFELLLIAVVTLLVVGPDRLPGVVTFLGHWIGRIRRMANHMRREIRDELEAEHLKSMLSEQNRELDELRQEVRGMQDDTETAVKKAGKGVSEAVGDLREAGADAADEATRIADEHKPDRDDGSR